MKKNTVNTLLAIAALGTGLAGLALVIMSVLGMGGDYALMEGMLFIVCGNVFNLILAMRKKADKNVGDNNNDNK